MSSIVLVMLAVPIWAQVVHLPTEDLDPLPLSGQSGRYLLGDWNGARTALAERGISFDLFYIAELQANPTGGLKQAQAGWERIRGTVDVNCDHIMQWQGLRFHATGLWQAGANLGVQIGTIANPSDLVSAHTTRLDSWWLEQYLCERSIKARPGGDLKILTSYVTGTPIKTKSSVHTAIGAGVQRNRAWYCVRLSVVLLRAA